MLRYSLGAPEAADRIDAAVDAVLAGGARTRDLGGDLGTRRARPAAGGLEADGGVPGWEGRFFEDLGGRCAGLTCAG